MSELGVVDALRLPTPLGAAAARVRALPSIAQGFLALALLDALARTLGILEPEARLDGGVIGLLGSYLPRDAWIVLPAIVVLRRRTAADDTPKVFLGAIGIAAVTLVAQPAMALLSGAGSPDFALFAWLNVVRSLPSAWSYLLLAAGLDLLNPRDPRPTAAGLANLAFIAIAISIVLQVAASIAVGNELAGDVVANLANLGAVAASQLALAAFFRAVIRGLADLSRPERATVLAAAAAVLLALAIAIEDGLAMFGAFAHGVGGLQDVLIGVSAWSSPVLGILELAGYGLLFVGFALGLADPLRPMAADWAAALRADPRAAPPPA